MDLKEFIVEGVLSIIDATHELQGRYKDDKFDTANINPLTDPNIVDTGGGTQRWTYRAPIQNIEFDIAVTASVASKGGGKGGLRILVADVSAHGEIARTSEQISRIKFSLPISLPPGKIVEP